MRGKSMPISRDVRVHAHCADDTAQSEPLAAHLPSDANAVKVMGFDRNDILFISSSVGTVQWHDSAGRPVAMLVRLKPDIWGFSKLGDEDWPQVLDQYGCRASGASAEVDGENIAEAV